MDMFLMQLNTEINMRRTHLCALNENPATRLLDGKDYSLFDQQYSLDLALLNHMFDVRDSLPKPARFGGRKPSGRRLVKQYERLLQFVAQQIAMEQYSEVPAKHNWTLLMHQSLHRYITHTLHTSREQLGLEYDQRFVTNTPVSQSKLPSVGLSIFDTEEPEPAPKVMMELTHHPDMSTTPVAPSDTEEDLDIPEFLRPGFQTSPA